MAITFERRTLFGGRVEFVPIKFMRDWMGNPKGKKMVMAARQAKVLFDRGTVKILEDKPKGDDKLITLKKRKAVASPPKNKMVEEAEMVK